MIAYAKDYMHVIFFGSILFFLQLTINASLVSRGDTKSLRNVHIVSFFLNIILNPIFIYGFYFIPAMGISGIAFATLCAQLFGLVYIIYKVNKTDLKKCDFILCTGLFDEHENDLQYYKNFLQKYVSKKLVCTNPDLTVHRGNVEELCAGSVAKVFEELGGEVTYFGKPHKEVYKMCFKSGEKVLAIGDNLRTDIKGANNLNIDCIFITDGVHRDEYKEVSELDTLLEKYKVKANFFQKQFKW